MEKSSGQQRYGLGQAATAAQIAAFDIDVGDYVRWGDAERLVVSVQALYDEFDGVQIERDPIPFFGDIVARAAPGARCSSAFRRRSSGSC